VAVTAGYVLPAPRAEFYAAMDAANVDLKSFDDGFYRRLTGAALAPVLDTIRYVHAETDCWLELTTLLIPGENDGDAELEALCAWVAGELGPDVPLHFTAFHPDFRLADRRPTPPATLVRARAIGRAAGLRHVYTGNVRDPEGASTRCHACGALLVGRDGFALTAWGLDGSGRCRACGEACAGVFEAAPGGWGARRLPVRPADFAAGT
jgi:pyruvate formate lyase activating enzyme